MGIALFGFDGWVAPLRSLVHWLLRPSCAPQRPYRVAPGASPAAPGKEAASNGSAHRPLRVVRVVEGSRAAPGAGRMFMSGRMADVCAELERLAALEAAELSCRA